MFGDFFKKIFKLSRTLYNYCTILAIFRVKTNYPMEFRRNIFEKKANWKMVFWKKKKGRKVSHGLNSAPKIFPARKLTYPVDHHGTEWVPRRLSFLAHVELVMCGI
jgi:hypothetical protein